MCLLITSVTSLAHHANRLWRHRRTPHHHRLGPNGNSQSRELATTASSVTVTRMKSPTPAIHGIGRAPETWGRPPMSQYSLIEQLQADHSEIFTYSIQVTPLRLRPPMEGSSPMRSWNDISHRMTEMKLWRPPAHYQPHRYRSLHAAEKTSCRQASPIGSS